MRKTMITLLVVVLLLASLPATTTGSNAEGMPIEMMGNSITPYFKLGDGKVVYCAEPRTLHPENGVLYYKASVQVETAAMKTVFVNAYRLNASGDMFHKVMQQALWSKLDPTRDYRANVSMWLGVSALELYDQLIAEVDTALYKVTFVTYITDAVPEEGARYQTMVRASVTEAIPTATTVPTPTATPTPEPTITPEPTVDPTATPTPKPTATPKPTSTPKPTGAPTSTPTATQTPEPTVSPEPTVKPDTVLGASDALSDVPHTGGKSLLAASISLFAGGGTMFGLISKRNRKKDKNQK